MEYYIAMDNGAQTELLEKFSGYKSGRGRIHSPQVFSSSSTPSASVWWSCCDQGNMKANTRTPVVTASPAA